MAQCEICNDFNDDEIDNIAINDAEISYHLIKHSYTNQISDQSPLNISLDSDHQIPKNYWLVY